MGNEVSAPTLEDLDVSSALEGFGLEDESILFTEAECFVYKVGARQSAAGYAAASWGLDTPILTGNLRVTACGDTVCIALWRKVASSPGSGSSSHPPPISEKYPLTLLPLKSGMALVALSKFTVSSKAFSLERYLEPVLDSSRYFVLRCQPPPGQRSADKDAVFLGIGFRHREAAFQLKACLADHIKMIARQRSGKKSAFSAPSSAAAAASAEAAGAVTSLSSSSSTLPSTLQGEGGEEEDDWQPFTAAEGVRLPPVSPPPPPSSTSSPVLSYPAIRKPPPPPSGASAPSKVVAEEPPLPPSSPLAAAVPTVDAAPAEAPAALE